MAKKVSSWLKGILPDDFVTKQAEFDQMNAFLHHYFGHDVFKHLDLMSCVAKKVVIAADSPQVAGFLKMKQQQLIKDMKDQLSVDYRLLIKTIPKGTRTINQLQMPKVKNSVLGSQVIKNLSKGIEDEQLRASLEKLAKAINK